MEQEIFPMPYHKYWGMWNELWRVAGNRDTIRPYSLRVGAGSLLDGPLTPALRGHLMSNTTAVFESSYQPEHIRQELMPIIFGTDAAGEHHSLFRSLQRATLLRDVNAPLYPTEEDEKSLRLRENITKLTWEYEQAKARSSSPDISRAYAALANRRKQILALMVEKRRGEDLEEVDRRRALGQSIEDIPIPRGTPPAPHPHDQGGYVGRA
ncbi:hypothetical protein QC762_0078090 [Podospora pseudocomata]|uniref:Uncharacterized protein n=1 Tax=Podospora pseudocomata TaxID=2093779 RepID=A0ABR0GBB6_9PEZI|nr:hypothetical protein QC762_0078090 [Podospora pseudocomata]